MSVEFGKWFTAYRKVAGYKSQRELAKVSGIHYTTISKIEKGETTPEPGTLKILSKYLNIPLNKMMLMAGHINSENLLPVSNDEKYREIEMVAMIKGYEVKGLSMDQIKRILDGVVAVMEKK